MALMRSGDLSIWDHALPNPQAVRLDALRSEWEDREGQDGEIYKRVCPTVHPEVLEAIEQAMGRKVDLLGMAYRLNFGGELPNNAIHTDLGWGTYAAVLYLSEPTHPERSGTAFWRHLATGAKRILPGDDAVLKNVEADWNNPHAWSNETWVEAAFNRLIIYRSELFHSRWPFEAHGTNKQDGRLIVVAFFN